MNTEIVVGIIGIMVALIILNYLMYIGVNPAISGVIGCAVISLSSGMNFVEAWDMAIADFSTLIGMLAPMFIFGGILGVFYTSSGATNSLADVLMIPAGKCKNPTLKIAVSIGMLLIFRIILGLAGLDSLAIMATMVYLLVSVLHSADIPRKYANAMLLVASTIGTLVPGAANQQNMLLEQYLGEYGYTANSTAALRWIMLLAYMVVCILLFTRLTLKSQEKGIHFDYGPLEHTRLQEGNKRPHWVLTLFPLLLVYIVYNFVGLPAWLSLVCGCILAIMLFTRYIPVEEGSSMPKTVLDNVNKGTYLVPLVMIFTMLSGYFLTQSPAYSYLTGLVVGLPFPPAFGLLIMAVLLIGIAGTAGLILAAIFAAETCLPAGMSATACAVIILWSNTVFDTLPNNLGLVMQNQLCGTTMKASYPAIFQTTVLTTFICALLATILAAIGMV